MPKGLKRYYGRGDLHFLTFSCYRRLPLLGTVRARNLFVQALGKIRERYRFYPLPVVASRFGATLAQHLKGWRARDLASALKCIVPLHLADLLAFAEYLERTR